MKTFKLLAFIALFATTAAGAQDLKLGALFTDEMVLQQKAEVPIWGWDKPGTPISITVSWDAKMYQVKTGNDGKWEIGLRTPAAGGPFTMTVKGSDEILLHDVMTGEVWLASGQSNMSMPLKGYFCQPVEGSNNAILHAGSYPVRFVNIPGFAAYRQLDDLDVRWVVASPETAGDCSAVAWFFATSLQDQIGKIPVGIINASYGGSVVEAWMPPSACRKFDDIPVPPESNDTSSWINNVPTVLYNGMIHALAGYGIKGMIWYQGESNIFNVPRYAPSVAAMVQAWREE